MLGYDWLVPVVGLDEPGALSYLQDALARRDELSADAARSLGKVGTLLDAYKVELARLIRTAKAGS